MENHPKELVEYLAKNNRSPFSEWLNGLRDIQARAIIRKRLNRVRMGNFGNTRVIGDSVYELKVYYGPGYRVYYGLDGNTIVVLLCGGSKGSQKADIKQAKEYWKDYWR